MLKKSGKYCEYFPDINVEIKTVKFLKTLQM